MSPTINLIKKSYKAIEVDVTCVAAITKAYFMIKSSKTDLDAAALVTKTITSASTASGQITVAGPTVATLRFFIGETDLDLLKDTEYPCFIKCISNGHAYAPPEGEGKVSISSAGILAVT